MARSPPASRARDRLPGNDLPRPGRIHRVGEEPAPAEGVAAGVRLEGAGVDAALPETGSVEGVRVHEHLDSDPERPLGGLFDNTIPRIDLDSLERDRGSDRNIRVEMRRLEAVMGILESGDPASCSPLNCGSVQECRTLMFSNGAEEAECQLPK